MQWLKRSLLVALGALGVGAGAAIGQQTEPDSATYPAHSVYMEAGGLPAFDGAPFSVNVEQRILPRTYLRVGVFYGPVDTDMRLKLPILLNYVTPGSVHNFDVGAGVRWDAVDVESEVHLAATIGYRYQELPRGALLRVGLNFDLRNLSGGSDAWTFGPWPSISAGFAF